MCMKIRARVNVGAIFDNARKDFLEKLNENAKLKIK